MSFVIDAPETLGGESAYLEVGGTFHLAVTGVYEGTMPPNKDGLAKDLKIGGFSVTLEVLDGEHKNKKCNLIFNNGDLSHKDQGLMARKKQAAFLIACDVIKPDDLGKKGLAVEPAQAVGSQVIAKLDTEGYKDNEGKDRIRVQLSYDSVHHVDDPRIARIPKDKTSIDSIPKENRHPAEYFAKLTQRHAPKAPAPVQSRVTDDDLDGIF